MALVDPLRYDTEADAIRRLHRTYLTYDSRPVYISGISGLHCDAQQLTKLGQINPITFHSSDTLLDLESPKIGWANIGQQPVYFFRTVHRQFSQGIDPRKAQFIKPSQSFDLQSHYPLSTTSQMVDFMSMMANDYPSIAAILGRKHGGAIARDWALLPTRSAKHRTIMYDFKPIGVFNAHTKTFAFPPDFLNKVRGHSLTRVLENERNFADGYVHTSGS